MDELDSIKGLRRGGSVTRLLASVIVSALVSGACFVLLHKYESAVAPYLGMGSAPTVDDEILVPDVLGLPQKLAKKATQKAGLAFEIEEQIDEGPPGVVLTQSPGAGSTLQEGDTVSAVLSVAAPKTAVPELKGLSLNDALAALHEQDLDLASLQVDGVTGSWVVSGTDPAAASELEPGSRVALTLKQKGIAVPSVVGMKLSKAKEALESAGLTIGAVRRRYDENTGRHIVLEQSPPANTSVASGTAVNIVANQGA